jgi:hypothetical protein
MPVKTITNSKGNTLKLGRNRPIATGPRFSLKNYLMRTIAPPPTTCDYSPRAESALSPVYMNDSLGDCVIAGMAHLVGQFTGNSEAKPFIFTDDQIISLYSAIGGYVPGQPSTDNGCDEVTALNYWVRKGALPQNKIVSWMAVNPSDSQEYRTAMYLFENLFFGIELPDAWINPFPSSPGFKWDVSGDSDPNNGHCVVGTGYTTEGVLIDTWGMIGTLTDAAIAKYCAESDGGDLYVVLSYETINRAKQRASNGLNWSQLNHDFSSLG